MFNSLDIIPNDRSTLHFISIENYSAELIERICSEVGKIWNGDLDGGDELDITEKSVYRSESCIFVALPLLRSACNQSRKLTTARWVMASRVSRFTGIPCAAM